MKKSKKWLCVLSALLIFAVYAIPVYAEEANGETGDTTLAPYFFIEDTDTPIDSFPLKETKVTANINGIIAETYVTQTYSNDGQQPVNACYVFPTSTKVTVHGMKMVIGNQVITAQIKEREEAKQEYAEAKSEGKSTSLLEQQRPNVFTMDVANIMPGDVVSIELHYTELITSAEGIYEFVFPTVVGPRYASPSEESTADTNQWVETPYLEDGNTPDSKYDLTVNLSTGVPIMDLTCKSHQTNVKWDNVSAAQVTLSSPEDFAGNRDFILSYKLTGQDVSSGLMLNTGESENFFMLTVQPPERFISENIPPREYIFVLDVSGSMFGYPLETSKELIRDLVTNLKETDSFNLILFSNELIQLAPKSVSANAQNIKSAMNLIDQREGGGGTELSLALESAIAIPMDENVSRSIVSITDGYISDEKNVFNLIHQNLDKASFFSFGIGDAVNRYLIDGIAKAGLGESFVVTDSADAKETANRFRTYIQSPILTDIHIEYEGFDAYDIEPATQSTLFAQKPIVLFGKWRGEPEGIIHLSGKTGNQDYMQDIHVSQVEPMESNQALPYLWARTKVERLMDYGCYTNHEDVKDEVTALGLNYSMMTEYTSFIAVTETVRNTNGDSTDVNQPLPLPENVSNLAVGGRYTIGSEPGNIILIVLMILPFFVSTMNRIRRKKQRL